MQNLTIGEFFEVAAAVLSADAKDLQRASRIELVESALHAPFAGFGEVELHPTDPEKIAVLGYRIARYHALPDGNKRTALIAMIILTEKNGGTFDDSNHDKLGDFMEAAAEGALPEEDFIGFIATVVTLPAGS